MVRLSSPRTGFNNFFYSWRQVFSNIAGFSVLRDFEANNEFIWKKDLYLSVRGDPSAKLRSKRPACPPKLAEPEGVDKRRLGRTISNSYKNIFLYLLLFFSSATATLHYVDFDVSMNLAAYEHMLQADQTRQRIGIPGHVLLDFFKKLYEKNNFLNVAPSQQPRIPKIIHQIWIGDQLPEKFKAFQESWRKHHPDWQYRLWTQHDLPTMQWQNIDLILKSRNPGEVSDIMRYEILHRFGGVYIDCDFECLQPLDELNHLYDFYIGIQPLDSDLVQLGIGLIGSVPGHPILAAAIANMRNACEDPSNHANAPAKTGPIYFTKIFFMMADSSSLRDIALPARYFYPLACWGDELLYEQWLQQGAFGVHHWAKSWLLPSFRKREFQEL